MSLLQSALDVVVVVFVVVVADKAFKVGTPPYVALFDRKQCSVCFQFYFDCGTDFFC